MILLAFLFIRDLEGIRTPNPQSRNLIFYPVELRGLFISMVPPHHSPKSE